MGSSEMLRYVATWGIPIQIGFAIVVWAWCGKRQLNKVQQRRLVRFDFWDALAWAVFPAFVPTLLVLGTVPWWYQYVNPYLTVYTFTLAYPIFVFVIGFIRWRRPMKVED